MAIKAVVSPDKEDIKLFPLYESTMPQSPTLKQIQEYIREQIAIRFKKLLRSMLRRKDISILKGNEHGLIQRVEIQRTKTLKRRSL